MPRVMKRQKFKDDDIAVCWMPFSAAIDGAPYTVKPGTRLRGDHPLVKGFAEWFHHDGIADDEIPKVPHPAAGVFEHERVRIPERLPDDLAAVATDSFWAGDRFVSKGQRLRRDDELVRKHPSLFTLPTVSMADVE